MKRDLFISGISGMVLGLLIFLAAGWIRGYIPALVSDLIAALIVFAILLLGTLLEMPLMVFALRKMAQNATTPRMLIAGGFLLYVMFAAVYAALFVLITGDRHFYLGTILATLGLARLASGIFIRSDV